jgi:hypothetical protein
MKNITIWNSNKVEVTEEVFARLNCDFVNHKVLTYAGYAYVCFIKDKQTHENASKVDVGYYVSGTYKCMYGPFEKAEEAWQMVEELKEYDREM